MKTLIYKKGGNKYILHTLYPERRLKANDIIQINMRNAFKKYKIISVVTVFDAWKSRQFDRAIVENYTD